MYENEKIKANYDVCRKKNSFQNVDSKLILVMVGTWGDISGSETMTAKVYTENIDSQLYCGVLETELRRSTAKFPQEN